MALRTPAGAGYLAADVLRSQRYLIPLVLYAAAVGILLGGESGPPPGPWPATTLALYPAAAWFALVLANTEHPVQRTITMAAAGGPGRIAAATLLAAFVIDAVLVAAPTAVPALRGSYPPAIAVAGAMAHIAAAATGTLSVCCVPGRSSTGSAGRSASR